MADDILLFQTDDGGEIEVIAGTFTVDPTPATAAYLSLFGGNDSDDGTAATESEQWWGNLLTDEQDEKLRSETQALLRALPAVTSNLRRVEDAVHRDLAWMVATLDAEITVVVTMPRLNWVGISGEIKVGDDTYAFSFEGQWGSA